MKNVSIVIPCYNQAQYLLACIDPCWFQTHANVVGDGLPHPHMIMKLPQRARTMATP